MAILEPEFWAPGSSATDLLSGDALKPSWSLFATFCLCSNLFNQVIFPLGEQLSNKFNIQKTKIMASGPITSWQIDGETVADFIFGGSKITAAVDCSHEIKRHLLFGRKVMTNLDSLLKKQRLYFINKGPSSQGYGSLVWMRELGHKESWAPKNSCFWTVVLEKTLESPLDSKEIQPVHPKSVLNIHWNDWCWSWNSSTLTSWCDWLTHLKRSWCWERFKAREGYDRGWDGWKA